jgi:hypothetical protein
MSDATNHLDKLLGLTKPIKEYTQEELTLALAKHFPTTRATRGIDEFLRNPLLANLSKEELDMIKAPTNTGLELS